MFSDFPVATESLFNLVGEGGGDKSDETGDCRIIVSSQPHGASATNEKLFSNRCVRGGGRLSPSISNTNLLYR